MHSTRCTALNFRMPTSSNFLCCPITEEMGLRVPLKCTSRRQMHAVTNLLRLLLSNESAKPIIQFILNVLTVRGNL